MKEFNLDLFTRRLRNMFAENMPYDDPSIHERKKHGTHIKNIAFQKNQIMSVGLDGYYFELGNEEAEQKRPSYHILEDAQVISKRNKATKSTKGSQDNVKNKGKRDYGMVSFTYTKNRKKAQPYYEYRKNVRGSRSLVGKSTYKVITTGQGGTTTINRNSKYYNNIHYHYIERSLEKITPMLADEFGLKLKRVSIDMTEEYSDYIDKLMSISDTYFNDIDF